MLVQSVPLHPGFAPSRCSVAAIRQGTCVDEVTVDSAEREQGPSRAVLQRVAQSTGASIVDPWVELCDPDRLCRTSRDGVALYRNWSHISVAASRVLAPAFAEALGQ